MCDVKAEDLLRIEKLLIEIAEHLIDIKKQNLSEVIKPGDKVIYKGETFYYIGFMEGRYTLGDRFLRPMIGVSDHENIIKEK